MVGSTHWFMLSPQRIRPGTGGTWYREQASYPIPFPATLHLAEADQGEPPLTSQDARQLPTATSPACRAAALPIAGDSVARWPPQAFGARERLEGQVAQVTLCG
jgi:hypothetical protein